jgi:hypothetical protein
LPQSDIIGPVYTVADGRGSNGFVDLSLPRTIIRDVGGPPTQTTGVN